MPRATDLAHYVVQQTLKPGDWAVDATVGQGHDTLFLARCVGPTGKVFGFDVQQTALAATAQRVEGMCHVTLVHCGHERLHGHVPEAGGRLKAVMFNLGYLPGGPKDLTTKSETTLTAVRQSLDLLAVSGVVTVMLYPGHPGGAEEAASVQAYAESLPSAFAASQVTRINAVQAAPVLLIIERLRRD